MEDKKTIKKDELQTENEFVHVIGDKYELTDKLGKGKFGEVYLCKPHQGKLHAKVKSKLKGIKIDKASISLACKAIPVESVNKDSQMK